MFGVYSSFGQSISQMAKLIANHRDVKSTTNRTAYEEFGKSIAISGDYAVVGAPGEKEDANSVNPLNSAGAAYVFKINAQNKWVLQQKIVATDRAANNRFGISVAISGEHIIIGSPYDEKDVSGGDPKSAAGSAYLFKRVGESWGQVQKIVPADRLESQNFGASVGIDGNYLVVGADNANVDDQGNGTEYFVGVAYVFKLSGNSWVQQQKLISSTRYEFGYFGRSVAISGNYIIASSPSSREDDGAGFYLNGAGSAFIFERDEVADTWTEQQKITPQYHTDGDQFGSAVSIDGQYAAIGAKQHGFDATNANELASSGAAYIFKLDNGTWIEQQKLISSDRRVGDNFGVSIAISGNSLVVGAEQQKFDSASANTLTSAGASYIFEIDGNSWIQKQKLSPTDRAANDRFGNAVALNGNRILIAAVTEDEDEQGLNTFTDAGSVYSFAQITNNWQQQQKINSADFATGDQFGASVAIHGDYAVIGAYGEDEDTNGTNSMFNAGAAFLFKKENGNWVFKQKIVAPDRAPEDNFGFGVSIQDDFVVIGSYLSDKDLTGNQVSPEAGAAYIFKRTNETWDFYQKLIASDRASTKRFGNAVIIKQDYIFIGSYADGANLRPAPTYYGAEGAVYIFKKVGGNWIEQQKLVAPVRRDLDAFGVSLSFSNPYLAIGTWEGQSASGDSLIEPGSVYIFKTDNTTFTLQQKINATDAKPGDNFGFGVEIVGDVLAVGAYGQDFDAAGANTLTSAGAVYLFDRSGETWTQSQKITAPIRGANDSFGRYLALSNNYLAIGSYRDDKDANEGDAKVDAGSVYLYKKSNAIWALDQKIVNTDRAAYDQFGVSIAISDDTFFIGANGQDYDVSGGNSVLSAGAVYIFGTQTTLPITLSAFKAQPQQNHALISWKVLSSQNFSHFELERSLDGKAFNQIKMVSFNGITSYSYLDQRALELNAKYVYYRLKLVDSDGSFEYSEVISIKIPSLSVANVRAYPNPFVDYVTVDFEKDKNYQTNIELFNNIGKSVLKQTFVSENNIEVKNLSALPSGVYLLRISNGNIKHTVKIIK